MHDQIISIILKSIQNVFKHKIILAKALVIPLVVIITLVLIQPDKPPLTYMILSLVAQWLIFTILAVTTHRVILLGPKSVTEWGLYFPGYRELNFFFHSFLIGLIMIPIGLAVLIPGIGIFITWFLAAYVIGRVSLVFPSISTDNPLTLSDSWNATHNYKILMFIVVVIFPFAISIPLYAIARIPNAQLSLIIENAFVLITMLFIVAALSESYRLIEGQFIESK